MKYICLVLSLLLLFTGCAGQEPAPPETVPEPTVQAEPQPPPPQPEPIPEAEQDAAPQEQEEEKPSVPEEPEEPLPQLPDLPEACYCWQDTAVAKDGTVVLQVPDHTLEICYDAVSGEPTGILTFSNDNLWTSNGIYNLQGQPLPLGSTPWAYGCAGDLMWYGGFRNFVVQRISDGEVLAAEVKQVAVMGDQVVLMPSTRFGSVVFLDSRTGAVTVEADRGFQPQRTFHENGAVTCMSVTAPDGVKETLLDHTGTPLLDSFWYEILDVQYGRAVVKDFRDGGYVRLVIDLDTQEVLYQVENELWLLPLPESLLIEDETGIWLMDYAGNRLLDTKIDHFKLYDWKEDGDPDYLVAAILRDGKYCTVLLNPDGTEVVRLPAEDPWQDVAFLSPTAVAYTVFSGEGPLYEDAYYRDLETGEEILLADGSHLYLKTIETTGGPMLRCEADGSTKLFLNDGTPVWDYPGYCHYIGSDVFSTAEGLRCLDGSWLYRPE